MSKRKKKKQITVVPSYVSDTGSVEQRLNQPVLSEFNVQETADTENVFPTISQAFPHENVKNIRKKDMR